MSLSFSSTLQYDTFVRGYSIIMFSMWSIGVDIPRLIVRYGKAYPLSINIHSISMLMIGLLTTMYVVAQIVIYNQQFGSSYTNLTGAAYGQFISSIILMCLVLCQFLLGFLLRVQMFSNSVKNSLVLLKTIHSIVGYGIIILGKIVASLIVNTTVSDVLFRAWLFFLAGFVFFFIILQVIYRSESRIIIFNCLFKHKNKHFKYHNEIYQNLLEKKQKFQNYKDKGIRYVIIDNCMYYIDQNFMHPGGEFIFNMLNGKQINYYLKGAKSITGDYPRHRHTKFVAKYLEQRIIGEVGVEPIVSNKRIAGDQIDWKILESISTNYPGTFLVTFQTQNGSVRGDLRLQNFGKYIMMGCLTEQTLDKTERPYYLCYSLSTLQVDVLDSLRKYYKYYYFQRSINEEQERKMSVVEQRQSGKLSFFIKQVKNGVFTKFLFNAPKQRIFSITGPYGQGLKLTEQSSGYYILIAGQTGVAAYIDFFSFLLQKTLYDLIRRKASSPSLHRINSIDTNYDVINNLKVLFIGSFNSAADFYLSTVIKQLYYLNLKHNLKTFNMMLHYSNSQNEQQIKMIRDIHEKEFFKTLMEEEEPDRVFFAGSMNLEMTLRKLEPELNLKAEIQYL